MNSEYFRSQFNKNKSSTKTLKDNSNTESKKSIKDIPVIIKDFYSNQSKKDLVNIKKDTVSTSCSNEIVTDIDDNKKSVLVREHTFGKDMSLLINSNNNLINNSNNESSQSIPNVSNVNASNKSLINISRTKEKRRTISELANLINNDRVVKDVDFTNPNNYNNEHNNISRDQDTNTNDDKADTNRAKERKDSISKPTTPIRLSTLTSYLQKSPEIEQSAKYDKKSNASNSSIINIAMANNTQNRATFGSSIESINPAPTTPTRITFGKNNIDSMENPSTPIKAVKQQSTIQTNIQMSPINISTPIKTSNNQILTCPISPINSLSPATPNKKLNIGSKIGELVSLMNSNSNNSNANKFLDYATKKVIDSRKEFEKEYLQVLLTSHPHVLEGLKKGKLDPEQTDVLKQVARDVASRNTL